MKYSYDAAQDFLEMARSDKEFGEKTKFLLPVISEEKERMLEKFDFGEESSFIAGIMLFGGHSLGLAAKHENVREIRESKLLKEQDKVLALHQNQTSPAEIVVLTLAGVDIFQTDYAFEAALEGKALIVKSTPSASSDQDPIATLLEKYKVQNELVKKDPALAIAICAEKLDPGDPKM